MRSDEEIARRSLHFQANAREYSFVELPTYSAWVRKKLDEGEHLELFTLLDTCCVTELPEDIGRWTDEMFDEFLAEWKEDNGWAG